MPQRYVTRKALRPKGEIYLFRGAKQTPRVRAAAAQISARVGSGPGSEQRKICLATEMAMQKLPHTNIRTSSWRMKWPRFFKTSEATLAGKRIGNNTCIDRTNLIVAVLRAAGVSAWVCRRMQLDWRGKRYCMHDFVEAIADGKIVSVSILNNLAEGVLEPRMVHAPGHKAFASGDSASIEYFLRGADSMHIGGVKGAASMIRFSDKFSDSKQREAEVKKNQKRLEILVAQNVIPQEAAEEMKSQGTIVC